MPFCYIQERLLCNATYRKRNRNPQLNNLTIQKIAAFTTSPKFSSILQVLPSSFLKISSHRRRCLLPSGFCTKILNFWSFLLLSFRHPLIRSPTYVLMNGANYTAPHYGIFFSFLLPLRRNNLHQHSVIWHPLFAFSRHGRNLISCPYITEGKFRAIVTYLLHGAESFLRS